MTSDDFDPRVHIPNKDASRSPVRRSDLKGLDEFADGLRTNTDLAHEFGFQAWQEVDQDHPKEGGRPGYRVIYKTIRSVPSHPAGVVSDNCRVLFANGTIRWGESHFGRALVWRRASRYLLPEWGRVYEKPFQYMRENDNRVNIEAHEETTPPMNYVEILYVLDQGREGEDHAGKLAAARTAIAPLLASLDLSLGPRILGLRITEKIGEVFSDWRWNRRLDGPTVALEAQAELRYVDADLVAAQLQAIFSANAGRSEEDRARLRIAAQWYWKADAEADSIQAFIAHWLTIEALEMEDANIAPVKAAVQTILGGDPNPIAAFYTGSEANYSTVRRMRSLRWRTRPCSLSHSPCWSADSSES